MISRRTFLGTAGAAAAAACAPAAAPVQPTGPAVSGATGWEKEWQDLVEAARKEGKVGVYTTSSLGYRKTFDDLLNPKWKRRIIMLDVRSGSTYNQMTAVRLARGEEALRRLIVDQQPFFTRDQRQVVEGLVRGNYAVSNNANQADLQEFLEA